MKVFENEFITMYFDAPLKSINHYWTDKTQQMSEEQFKETLLKIYEVARQNGAINLLSDARKFVFSIVPEVQSWTNDNFFVPFYSYGLKRYAILTSEEVFTQLSIDQTIEEEAGKQLPIKYFDNEDKAKEWIGKGL